MKMGTCVIGFVLLSTIFNVYELSGSWVWWSFIKGIVCGIPIITIWWKSKNIGLLLGGLAVVGLFLTAFGLFDGIERDRIFFSGASIGFLLGFIPAYHLNKPISYSRVSALLSLDGYSKLALKFSKKYEDASKY